MKKKLLIRYNLRPFPNSSVNPLVISVLYFRVSRGLLYAFFVHVILPELLFITIVFILYKTNQSLNVLANFSQIFLYDSSWIQQKSKVCIPGKLKIPQCLIHNLLGAGEGFSSSLGQPGSSGFFCPHHHHRLNLLTERFIARWWRCLKITSDSLQNHTELKLL